MKSFLKIIVLTFYISVLNHNIYAQELKKTSKAIIKENFINGPLGRQPATVNNKSKIDPILCSDSVVPPVLLNGVNVTSTFSGDVGSYPLAYSSCIDTAGYTTPANSIYLGSSSSFVYTFDFSQPINNLVIVITGTGELIDEIFNFTTSSGNPTITDNGSCNSTITGSTISSGAGALAALGGGGGVFTISNATPFTSMTISGPGGTAGSLFSLCASSVNPNLCNAGSVAPILSATSLSGLCANTTVNLNNITAFNTPAFAGVSLTWFTGANPSSSNQLTSSQVASAPAGATYYAAFFDSVNNCYSITTAVSTNLIVPVNPTFNSIGPFCEGSNFSLPTTSNNGITGSWQPAINNAITTTYTFTPTIGLCANTVTKTIVVNPKITPTFLINTPICEGDLISLPATSNNGITGSWQPAINNAATTTYTFTPTVGLCANTAIKTIVVNPKITPTFLINTPICEGDVISLPTTSNNGITGSWQPAINNAATTTYTFTPTIGLCANNVTKTIVVNPKITPTFLINTPICEGDIISLPATSNNGITGSWQPAINNAATTTYTFTPTVGLCANNATKTIVVNPKITPTFLINTPICEGDIISLPATSNNGITGSWQPAINNAATTTYTFTPTIGLCANTATKTIVVNPKITPTFLINTPICYGDNILLPTISNNGITGSWQPAINNKATTTYTFTPTIGLCAVGTTKIINVLDDFDFEVSGNCVEEKFILNSNVLNNSFNANAVNYQWQYQSVNVGSSAPVFEVNSLSSSIAMEVPITINLTITNTDNCSKTKSIVLDNIYCSVQKGISPNDDNKNDYFDLRLLNVDFLTVYNRYGLKVYTKENYTDQWKGQTNSSDILPDGVYFYVIEFKGTKKPKNGWIYLNKQI